MKLGWFTHLDQHQNLEEIYHANLRLIVALEQQGFDNAWIAMRHFNLGKSTLPTPFSFLGAASALTSRIGLGTAVVVMQPEDPLRLAQEAAVLDYLSHGRLHLGVGKGVPSDSYHLYEAWDLDRDGSYHSKLTKLRWALEGRSPLYPPRPELTDRIYQATASPSSVEKAARNGDGLLVARKGNPKISRDDFLTSQVELVTHYISTFKKYWGSERSPYVAVTRSLLPIGLEEADKRTQAWYKDLLHLEPKQRLLADNVICGEPDYLAQTVSEDPVVGLANELILCVHPATMTIDETISAAHVLKEEVASRLR